MNDSENPATDASEEPIPSPESTSKPKKQRGRPTSKASGHDKILVRQREIQAIQLKRAGATYDEIGEQLGVGGAAAYRIVSRYLARVRRQFAHVAEDVVAIELERCDGLLVQHYATMSTLDPADVDGLTKITKSILNVMDRRARYLGLNKDSPLVNVKVDNRKTTNNVDVTIGEQQTINVVVPILKGATLEELRELRDKLQGIKSRNDGQVITQAGRIAIEARVQSEEESSNAG